jgi:phage/plasmid-associated DNA primase
MENQNQFLPSLKTTNSYLKKIAYRERINPKRLFALLSSKSILKENDNWLQKHLKPMYGKKPNEKYQLELLLNKLIFEDGKYYLKTRYFSKSNYGRIYPNSLLSLSILRRDVRHFLSNDLYFDIDIVCCFQTILKSVTDMKGYDNKYLTEYIENRDEKLAELMKATGWSRDICKTLFIAVMNTGSVDKYCKDNKVDPDIINEFVYDFVEEVRLIGKKLQRCNVELFDEVTQTSSNKKATFISYFLMIYEQKILSTVYDFAVNKELIDNFESQLILCHDGIMMEKDLFDNTKYSVDNFIHDINMHIAKELSINIKFKVKEMGEGKKIEEQLQLQNIDYLGNYVDHFYEKYGVRRNEEIESDDTTIAKLFYSQQQDKFVLCDRVLYKRTKEGFYKVISMEAFSNIYTNYMMQLVESREMNFEYEESIHQRYIELLEKNNVKKKISKSLDKLLGEAEKSLKKKNDTINDKIVNTKAQNYVVKRLLQLYSNDEFLDLLDADATIIAFTNGVFDTKTYEFRKILPGEFVKMNTGYDYFVDDEVIAAADRIYNIINQSQQSTLETDYILKAVSRGLKGDSNIEQIAHFLLGEGGNCKGLLIKFIENSFGEYFYDLSYTYFTKDHKNEDNRDPTLYGSKRKRIINVSECPTNITFNVATFKRTTGNDNIKCRTNFQKEDTKFQMGHLFFAANGVLKFSAGTKDAAMTRRVRAMDFKFKFVTKEDKLKDYKDKEDYKIKDETLGEFAESDTAKRGFMYLLIKYFKKYQEEGLKLTKTFETDTKNYVDKMGVEIEEFINRLKPCAEDKKGISLSSLKSLFNREYGTYYSAHKFGQEMESRKFVKSKGDTHDIYGKSLSSRNRILVLFKDGWEVNEYGNDDTFVGGDDDELDYKNC